MNCICPPYCLITESPTSVDDPTCYCGEPFQLVDVNKGWQLYVADITRGVDGRLMVRTHWEVSEAGVSDTDATFVECLNGHRITEFKLEEPLMEHHGP